MMQVFTLLALKDNFVYILAKNGEAAVVDPGEASPVRKFLDHKRLKLKAILCTHHHQDHIGGVESLAGDGQVEVWASTADRHRIPGVTRPVSEGDSLKLFDEEIRVLDIPGHTLGQIAYYIPAMDALFPGDTLFSGGCGRLFEGTIEQMFASLQKIKLLPASTRIYFGHEYTLRNLEFIKQELGQVPEDVFEYEQACKRKLHDGEPTSPTTLAQEIKINPFIYSRDVGEFRKWRLARDVW